MEHLVSQHVIVATGEGCKVIRNSENIQNKSQKRFKLMEEHSEWNKNLQRESQQISTDTHTTHLGHDDKVRKRNISGGWMSELSQRNGCRVLNVGGSEVGGSFMEPHDHSASELWLYVLQEEKWEICVHYFTTFFKGDYFSE